MKKLKTSLLAIPLLISQLYSFNIFTNEKSKETPPKIEKPKKISKEEKTVNSIYLNSSPTLKLDSIGLSTKDITEVDYGTLNKIKKDIPLLKKEIALKEKKLKEYIQMQKYEKSIKKIYVSEKQRFLTLLIPVAQQSTIVFDKVIKKIEYLDSNNVELIWNKEKENKYLKIKNLNPRIQMNVKITFYDESILNILFTTGELKSERYIEYEIYTNTKKVETLKSFQKKIKIENIHDYFNNVSVKLILDYLQKKNDYEIIMNNLVIHNKVLNKSEALFKTPFGEKKIKYEMVLNSSFPTQFVKDTKDKTIKRLVMLFLNVKNLETDKVLVLNKNFITKRFSRFTSFYLGNLKNKDNEIAPLQSKNIIVVIEVEEKGE